MKAPNHVKQVQLSQPHPSFAAPAAAASLPSRSAISSGVILKLGLVDKRKSSLPKDVYDMTCLGVKLVFGNAPAI